jgi:hypothetical protein
MVLEQFALGTGESLVSKCKLCNLQFGIRTFVMRIVRIDIIRIGIERQHKAISNKSFVNSY